VEVSADRISFSSDTGVMGRWKVDMVRVLPERECPWVLGASNPLVESLPKVVTVGARLDFDCFRVGI